MSNFQPVVSVLVPVYNQEKFIGATLESVIKQTYSNWELLVVDDNSADNSWEIIQQYARKDPRIKIFRNATNVGLVSNWKFLIDRAEGDCLAFLEGDDIYLPENLAAKIEIFAKFPEVEMVYNNFQVVDENGEALISDFYKKLNVRTYKNQKIDPADYFYAKHTPFSTYSQIMLKKDALKTSGYPRSFEPEKKIFLPSDWDFNFNLSTKNKVYCLDQVLLKYRKHAGNNSRAIPEVARQLNLVLDNYEKEFAGDEKILRAIRFMRGKTVYFKIIFYLENGEKKAAWREFRRYFKKYPANFRRDLSMNTLLVLRLLLPNRLNVMLKEIYFGGLKNLWKKN